MSDPQGRDAVRDGKANAATASRPADGPAVPRDAPPPAGRQFGEDRDRTLVEAAHGGLRSGITERELRQYQEGLEHLTAERATALSLANARLEAAKKELEAFSYSVSHDLRTPLRAIDGFSRILFEDYADKLDAEGRRVLAVLRDSTVKMGQLIEDILAFSCIGRAAMESAPVDMEALVRQALAGPLAPAMAGRKLAIDVAKLPAAQGDRAMLAQVWISLLDNAIKFTAAKPDARIAVSGTAGDSEAVYCVGDNGVGFDLRYADRLFGVFRRLHGGEFAGTGIGLAIVKRIITRHGGCVWAEGKVGEGAMFCFALPVTGVGAQTGGSDGAPP